jgi:hypothetical protein
VEEGDESQDEEIIANKRHELGYDISSES